MEPADIQRLRIEKNSFPSGKGKRRLIFPALMLILAVVIAGLYRMGFLSPAVAVETGTVSQYFPSQGETLLNAAGYVVAQRKAAVAAKQTGRLVWIGVEEGSRVRKGDPIARLESDDMRALVDQAAAAVEGARAGLDQARAEREEAERLHRRYEELLREGIASQAEYDAVRNRFERGRAGVAAAESALSSARAALSAAQVNLSQTEIRAPFDGVVLTKNADPGDIVTPLGAAADSKSAVVTMADPASLLVEADVSEANLSSVRMGAPCEILLDALPGERFPGTVHSIVPTAERTKGTVMVKIRFDRIPTGVLPEMSARVAFLGRRIPPGENRPKVVVRRDAIARIDGRPHLFLPRGDRAHPVPVTVTGELGDLVEIGAGVKPGDRIIVSPVARLKDGSRIRIGER